MKPPDGDPSAIVVEHTASPESKSENSTIKEATARLWNILEQGIYRDDPVAFEHTCTTILFTLIQLVQEGALEKARKEIRTFNDDHHKYPEAEAINRWFKEKISKSPLNPAEVDRQNFLVQFRCLKNLMKMFIDKDIQFVTVQKIRMVTGEPMSERVAIETLVDTCLQYIKENKFADAIVCLNTISPFFITYMITRNSQRLSRAIASLQVLHDYVAGIDPAIMFPRYPDEESVVAYLQDFYVMLGNLDYLFIDYTASSFAHTPSLK